MNDFFEVMHPYLPQIITAFSTIAGAFFGGCFVYFGNKKNLETRFKNEETIRKETLRRERVEELFIQFKKYVKIKTGDYIVYHKVINGELTFNQALDNIVDFSEKKPCDYDRMVMIINMYFSDLLEDFKLLESADYDVYSIVESFKIQYKTGDYNGEKFKSPFVNSYQKFLNSINVFEQKIIVLNS